MSILHCLELVYSKNICFEINQNSGKTEFSNLEQMSVIKFLLAKKYKPCEIYRRMYDVYREAGFSQENVK